jgi:glycosyltransferase involved in cell wall biosynthesis
MKCDGCGISLPEGGIVYAVSFWTKARPYRAWEQEYISNAVVEAMAAGKPVVAFDIPMTREVLEEGAGVLLFLECAGKTALLDGLAVVPDSGRRDVSRLLKAATCRRTPKWPCFGVIPRGAYEACARNKARWTS